jgi:hypothetical protein
MEVTAMTTRTLMRVSRFMAARPFLRVDLNYRTLSRETSRRTPRTTAVT